MARSRGPSSRRWPKARASLRPSCGGSPTLKFRAGELEFNANVSESGEIPSLQSGDSLRALTIQFRAQKAAVHEQALSAAIERQNGGLFSLTDQDEPDLEWRV